MTSIVPFINNAVFEPADIKVMSDAYNRAIGDIYRFGHPNKVVGEIIATRIITLTKGGERDPDRLCERALAACGFDLASPGWPARRAPLRHAAHHRRCADRGGDRPHPGEPAAGCHALEFAQHGPRQRRVDLQRAAHLARLRPAAASAGDLQAVHRSGLRRQGARRRRPLRLAAEHAIVLCVDEKSQIQALDRSQPLLPMRPGQPARRSHDYKRHGTTSLFAALDIATGQVIGKCFPRHRASSSASSSTRSRPTSRSTSTSIWSSTTTPPTRPR